MTLHYRSAQPTTSGLDVTSVEGRLLALMLRSVATDGYRFVDPTDASRYSLPGCVLASPSYPVEEAAINQDYVYNWTRDAAVTAFELAAATGPAAAGIAATLADYVRFADVCQSNTEVPTARGCYLIDASARNWTDQSDGPALRILAVLQILPRLDPASRTIAERVLGKDLDCVLEVYTARTTSLWEEHTGWSFFARSVQLRALREAATSPYAAERMDAIIMATAALADALVTHWTGAHYATLLGGDQPAGYDPNADILMACIYGAVDVLDSKLLATVSALHAQWTEPDSPYVYPVNLDDAARGIGPLLGRYPDDHYDGDTGDKNSGDRHPWALVTCNAAELYYRVAARLGSSTDLVIDDRTTVFYQQVGIGVGTSILDARTLLGRAGDRMLQAVLFHSDHLELSEQFDGTTGYQKSVQNLTWSYAAFLSALRARRTN